MSIDHNIPKILECRKEFTELCKKIDSLENFLAIVNQNLTHVEEQVIIAEEELGINDTGIKGFLKPLFGKTKSENDIVNKNPEKNFIPVEIFNVNDYFPSSSS